MKIIFLLFASLFFLSACSSATATPAPLPTAAPSATPIPPTATAIPQYERLSPTVVRIKDAVIVANVNLTETELTLTFDTSIPSTSPNAADLNTAVQDAKFEFPDGPALELQPDHGGGGGGGGDPQGFATSESMQAYQVKTPIKQGQLIHVVVHATFDPSTGITEPVPFEMYVLVGAGQ